MIGKRKIFELALAISLALGLGRPSSAEEAKPASRCKLTRTTELTVKFEDDRPLIEATLNGHRGWFLIDTGAASTLLFGDAAAAFKLPLATDNSITFQGVGGSRAAKIATVESLRLGSATAKNSRFMVLDEPASDKTPEVFGVLGRDVLEASEVELDFPHKAVRLWSFDNCSDEDMPYWATRYAQVDIKTPPTAGRTEVWVPAALNGRPILAQIDTGSQVSVVTPGVVQSAGALVTTKSAGKVAGIGPGALAVSIAEFKTFQLGEEKVAPVKLRVADLDRYNKQLGTNTLFAVRVVDHPSMLLGADFLRSHRVLISYKRRRVYFSYEGGPTF